ncbi:hypothetical protein [Streptomyces sp. NPDC007883]|uniref:hypothetical protein n=1 Tax=Streptomyces sp. NPDC007883 TaxID=3155116 RepID=UPI0033D9EE74
MPAEEGPRGPYGDAVLRGKTAWALDAVLALRTRTSEGKATRRGCARARGSPPSPARSEIEKTCEKLRSVAPHLRFATD